MSVRHPELGLDVFGQTPLSCRHAGLGNLCMASLRCYVDSGVLHSGSDICSSSMLPVNLPAQFLSHFVFKCGKETLEMVACASGR